MRNGPLDGVCGYRPDNSVLYEIPNDADRFVLEADGPGERNRQTVGQTDQGQFIGQQTPASIDQPRGQRAFAGPRRGRQNGCAALTFDDSGMNDEVLIGMARNAPVHAPLKHRHSLIQAQRFEGQLVVEIEEYLWPVPSPESRRTHQPDVEIRKLRVLFYRKVGVQQMDGACQRFDGALDVRLKG